MELICEGQHAGLAEGNMKEQLFAFTSSLKDAGSREADRNIRSKNGIILSCIQDNMMLYLFRGENGNE
mgnify:FL=1